MIINPRYIAKNNPDLFSILEKTYPDVKSISERLYLYQHSLDSPCKCVVCGKNARFNGISKGYSQYCSCKCSNSDPNKKEKTKKTCLKKYGCENPMQNEKVKNSFVNYFSIPENQKKIQDKREKETGVRFTGQLQEVKDKIRHTCIERYGVESSVQTHVAKENLRISRIKKQTSKYEDIVDCGEHNDEYMYKCSCPHHNCSKCNDKYYWIETQMYFDRRRDGTEPCTHLLPARTNSGPSSLENIVCEWLDEYNIYYERSRRDILPSGQEIDIYIPSKRIAIECNGEWYHCSKFKPYNYHFKKWSECKEIGIQLLSMWGVWINFSKEITKSILLSKLGIYNRRLYARKCKLNEISSSVCNKFLNENHIQGASKSKIYLGLYYNNELVSVMTFNRGIKCSGRKEYGKDVWDLARFCSLKGTCVVGAAGKLLKYFIRKYNPSTIQSYSSNDISDGGLYVTLGFKQNSFSQSYWYYDVRGKKRYHRSAWTKSRLKKMGLINEEETEECAMYRNGFLKNYDSGQTKWVWKREN